MTETVDDTAYAEAQLTTLYEALKHHTQKVRRDRRLPVPPADSVTVHSRQCGSQITLDAEIESGILKDIGYRVRACSLGQATTAIVAEHAQGLDAATARRIGKQLEGILAGENTHCDWPELEIFALIKDAPTRHGSALLPFQALEKLFERAGGDHADGSGNTHVGSINHNSESN